MEKMLRFEDSWRVDSFPVVITTARLVEASFDMKNVPLKSGTIDSKYIALKPLDFCAVNYHADHSLAVTSEHSFPIKKLDDDAAYGQTRTVFVVSSDKLSKFLDWFEKEFP